MARAKISEFSATAADNTDIDNIDIAEGCAPSGINNAIRELMAQLKDFQTGAAGDPFNGAVNGTVGATTPAAGAFTTLSASSTVSGTGFSNYFASPPAIGGTAAAAGTFTNLAYTGTLTGGTGVINIGSGQVYKDASGKVGIGTTAPILGRLNITTGFAATDTTQRDLAFFSSSDTAVVGSAPTGLYFSYTGSGSLAARTADIATATYGSGNLGLLTFQFGKVVISGTGNVGVGISSSATNRLNVGAAAGTYAATFYANTGAGVTTGLNSYGLSVGGNVSGGSAEVNLIYGSAGGGLAFNSFNGTTITERMRLDQSGNLGLGVTPSAWTGGFKALEMSNGSVSINANGPFVNQNAVFAGGWKYTATGAAAQYQQIAGAHQWFNAPSGTAGNAISFTQAMTLTSGGNLGVGIDNPAGRLHLVSGAGTKQVVWSDATNGTGYMDTASGASRIYTNVALAFGTGNDTFSEKARIDSSGNLLVGTSTNPYPGGGRIASYRPSSGQALIANHNGAGGATVGLWCEYSNTTGTGYQIYFTYNQTNVGLISSTSTATAYGTTSDYRLKENVAPMTGALAKVAQLKPCTYTWKANGSNGQGFIAHELQEVVPDCVTGEKDAVDKDGKPNYQGVDTSFLVATVVAALQELKAEFDAYKLSHP